MSALPENNRSLLAAVRAWCATNYPGCPLEYLTLHLRFLPVPIQLPESPVVAPGVAEVPRADEERGHGLSPCILDILKVLRDVKKPLSRTRLLEEMAKHGMDWNERTVAGYLARLVEDGTLENDPAARPRGYRLPEGEE